MELAQRQLFRITNKLKVNEMHYESYQSNQFL